MFILILSSSFKPLYYFYIKLIIVISYQEFLIRLLEKNYSSLPEDKLSTDEINYIREQQNILPQKQFDRLKNIAKSNMQKVQQMSQYEQLKYSESQNEAYHQQELLLLQKEDFKPETAQADYQMNDNIQPVQQGIIEQQQTVDELKFVQLMNKYNQQKDFTLLLQNRIRDLQRQSDYYEQIINKFIFQTGGYQQRKKYTDEQKKQYMETFAAQWEKSAKKLQYDIKQQCQQLRQLCYDSKLEIEKLAELNLQTIQKSQSYFKASQKYDEYVKQEEQQIKQQKIEQQQSIQPRMFLSQDKISFTSTVLRLIASTNYVSLRIIEMDNLQLYDLLNRQAIIQDIKQTKVLLVEQKDIDKLKQYLNNLPNNTAIYVIEKDQFIVFSQKSVEKLSQILHVNIDQIQFCQ